MTCRIALSLLTVVYLTPFSFGWRLGLIRIIHTKGLLLLLPSDSSLHLASYFLSAGPVLLGCAARSGGGLVLQPDGEGFTSSSYTTEIPPLSTHLAWRTDRLSGSSSDGRIPPPLLKPLSLSASLSPLKAVDLQAPVDSHSRTSFNSVLIRSFFDSLSALSKLSRECFLSYFHLILFLFRFVSVSFVPSYCCRFRALSCIVGCCPS